MERNHLVGLLCKDLNYFGLGQLEGFVKTDLDLAHVDCIGKSDNLNYAIRNRLLGELFILVSLLPKVGNPSSPMENIQENNVLELINLELLSIHLDSEDFTQRKVVSRYHVNQTHLSVNQFVAELRKKKLWMLFPHFVEILAYLRIQPHSSVVVNCELLLTGVFALDCHFPSV